MNQDEYSFSVLALRGGEGTVFRAEEEVLFLMTAEGSARVDGLESGVLSVNDYCIAAPGEELRVSASQPDGAAFWLLRTGRAFLREISASGEDLWAAFFSLPVRIMDARHINNMILRELMQNLMLLPGASMLAKTYTRLHAGIIATVVARTCRLQPPGERRAQQPPLSMTDVYGYVRTHLQGDLSLPAIARALHFSESYLAHAFRRHTGMSVHQYVLSRRLEYANTLLAQGQSVRETAARSGFRSAEAFIRAYQKRWAMTPGQYAAQEKKKAALRQARPGLRTPDNPL